MDNFRLLNLRMFGVISNIKILNINPSSHKLYNCHHSNVDLIQFFTQISPSLPWNYQLIEKRCNILALKQLFWEIQHYWNEWRKNILQLCTCEKNGWGVILWFSSVMIQSSVVQYGVLQYVQCPVWPCSGTDQVTRCPVVTMSDVSQAGSRGPWRNGLAPIGLN